MNTEKEIFAVEGELQDGELENISGGCIYRWPGFPRRPIPRKPRYPRGPFPWPISFPRWPF